MPLAPLRGRLPWKAVDRGRPYWIAQDDEWSLVITPERGGVRWRVSAPGQLYEGWAKTPDQACGAAEAAFFDRASGHTRMRYARLAAKPA